MKTGKVIEKEDYEAVLNSEQYMRLFEKRSAKLLLNVDLKSGAISYSVVGMKHFFEDRFDLLFDAANRYNNLP